MGILAKGAGQIPADSFNCSAIEPPGIANHGVERLKINPVQITCLKVNLVFYSFKAQI